MISAVIGRLLDTQLVVANSVVVAGESGWADQGIAVRVGRAEPRPQFFNGRRSELRNGLNGGLEHALDRSRRVAPIVSCALGRRSENYAPALARDHDVLRQVDEVAEHYRI